MSYLIVYGIVGEEAIEVFENVRYKPCELAIKTMLTICRKCLWKISDY